MTNKSINRMATAIVFGTILATTITGCGKVGIIAYQETPGPQESVAAEYSDSTDNATTREFVEVMQVTDDYITLKNTHGTLYRIDAGYNDHYTEGDLLCVVFREKEEIDQNLFKIEPIELYVNENRTDIPTIGTKQ